LADANERRDWRMYRDYAELLIKEAQKLYGNDLPADLDLAGAVYAIDSTTIEVCLSLFPWARLVKKRAALKMNVQLNISGNIPSFFDFSSGREHDIHFLDRVTFEIGAYYIMDRGYLDFSRLYNIHQTGSFFVTRAKQNTKLKRVYSNPVSDEEKSDGIRCDQIVMLTGNKAKKDYPEKLRRIKYYDVETRQYYVFLTNDFVSDAKTITLLYKYRWQIELFFKWIKQHLSIEIFWGRSENAVKTQICIALCAYLLVAILKKKLAIDRNSYEILQILSVSLFDKMPFYKLISKHSLQIDTTDAQNQAQLSAF
jgi:transposase